MSPNVMGFRIPAHQARSRAPWPASETHHISRQNPMRRVKTAIILDVEATRAIRQAEVSAARTMIDRTEARFGLKPQRLTGYCAYRAAEIDANTYT